MQHKRTEVLQQLSYLISLAIVHLLSSHALSEEQRNLLQSTKTLGQVQQFAYTSSFVSRERQTSKSCGVCYLKSVQGS